jgi:predicted DCC family thiol-disulfide oxidoreductase YuxK
MSSSNKQAVVLFDGVCNLCNGAVTFIIDRDPAVYFRFAPLQSEVARRLLNDFEVEPDLSSLVLLEDGQCYTRSTAALHIAKRLRGGWPLLFSLMVIPKPARDYVYAWVAANRYRWFGKMETCRVPTPELTSRFM